VDPRDQRHAPLPDLTLVLDVPAEVAFARVQRRMADGGAVAERFDALALQRRIADHYRRLRGTPPSARSGSSTAIGRPTRSPTTSSQALLRGLGL
jgi:hypothetical protein